MLEYIEFAFRHIYEQALAVTPKNVIDGFYVPLLNRHVILQKNTPERMKMDLGALIFLKIFWGSIPPDPLLQSAHAAITLAKSGILPFLNPAFTTDTNYTTCAPYRLSWNIEGGYQLQGVQYRLRV